MQQLTEPSPEAVKWWNSVIGETNSSRAICETAPDIRELKPILGRLSPLLLLPFGPDNPESYFWTKLHRIVILFHPCDFVPVPNILFRPFVSHLYLIHESFKRRDVDLIIKILEQTDGSASPKFLFWQFQDRLKDPELAIETLLALVERKHLIWRTVAATRGIIDSFFDRYLPLLDQEPEKNSHGVLCAMELLVRVFLEYARSLTNMNKVINELWHKLTKFLRGYNFSVAVSAFRCLTQLWSETKDSYASSQHAGWLTDLINSSVRPCLVHDLVLNFVMGARLAGFNVTTLIRTLIAQEVEQPSDLVQLKKLCMMPCCQNHQMIIKHFFQLCCCNVFWSTGACECVKELLPKFKDKPGVISWTFSFTKRAFVFVAIASNIRKYKRRCHAIIRTYDELFTLKIEGLNLLVRNWYSSLINSKIIENHTQNIEVLEDVIDEEFVILKGTVEKQEADLKSYLVSTLTTEDLIQPVKSRSSTLKKDEKFPSYTVMPKARRSLCKPVMVSPPKRPMPASGLPPARRARTGSYGNIPVTAARNNVM